MPASTQTSTSTPQRLSEGIGDEYGLKVQIAKGSPTMQAPSITVPVSYFDNRKFTLAKPRVSATGVSITAGGAMKGLPAGQFKVKRIVGLDSTGAKGYSDTFFLDSGTLNLVNPITLAGLIKISGVTCTVQDLSNHPVLLAEAKRKSGFLGKLALKASKVEIPLIPKLVIACKTPTQHTNKAWGASYDVANGKLTFELDHAAYTTDQVAVDVDDSQLTISNDANNIDIKGAALLSLPQFGLNKISSTLDLKLANKKLSSFDATIAATTPLTSLGIVGDLAISHNFLNNTGAITLTNGTIAGVGVKGSLSYSASGASTDQISGALTIDNLTGNGLKLGSFDLSIVPLSGTAEFSYAPKTSASPGGYLNFTNVDFDLVTGISQTKASFTGNLKLALDQNGATSLKEFDLTLKNPVSIELGSLGRVSLDPVDANTPVKFALKTYTNDDGTTDLAPTLTGRLTYAVGGATVTAQGIAYELDPWTGTREWTALQVSAA